MSLAKGPVGIIGLVLLAGGVLGLLFGSTDFTTSAPNGDVSGGTWLGIEGNGWTWLLFAGGGLLLLLSAPMHWSAKTMAMIVGLAGGPGILRPHPHALILIRRGAKPPSDRVEPYSRGSCFTGGGSQMR